VSVKIWFSHWFNWKKIYWCI